MCATSGAGTAYHSGAHEFTPGFSGVRATRSFVLYVCFIDRCLYFKHKQAQQIPNTKTRVSIQSGEPLKDDSEEQAVHSIPH
jgi:hypothetical protein